jgi:hypothetical protein
MVVRDLGCEPQQGRGGTFFPLALEIDADDGVVSIPDRNIADDVRVGGRAFDIVAEGYVRAESTCADCPPSESQLLILRADLRAGS